MALVAHWKLQDNAGSTTVTATVGSNGTAARNTSLTSTTGPGTLLTLAYNGNGTSDYVDVATGNTAAIQNKSFATVMAWAKWSGISSARNIIVARTATNVTRLAVQTSGTGAITAGGRAGDGETYQSVTTTSTYDDDTWRHVAAVYDYAADSITIYVDGSSVATTGTPAFTASATSNTATTQMRLASNTSGVEFWQGGLADVRIYDSDESANLATIMAEKDTAGGSARLLLANAAYFGRQL